MSKIQYTKVEKTKDKAQYRFQCVACGKEFVAWVPLSVNLSDSAIENLIKQMYCECDGRAE